MICLPKSKLYTRTKIDWVYSKSLGIGAEIDWLLRVADKVGYRINGSLRRHQDLIVPIPSRRVRMLQWINRLGCWLTGLCVIVLLMYDSWMNLVKSGMGFLWRCKWLSLRLSLGNRDGNWIWIWNWLDNLDQFLVDFLVDQLFCIVHSLILAKSQKSQGYRWQTVVCWSNCNRPKLSWCYQNSTILSSVPENFF